MPWLAMLSVVSALALIGVACGGGGTAQVDDDSAATITSVLSGGGAREQSDGTEPSPDHERRAVILATTQLAGDLRNEMLLTSEVHAGVEDADEAMQDLRGKTDEAVTNFESAVADLVSPTPRFEEATWQAGMRLDNLTIVRGAADAQTAPPVDTTFQYWSIIDDVLDVATAVQFDSDEAATVRIALTVAAAQRLFATTAATAAVLTPLLAESAGVIEPAATSGSPTAAGPSVLDRIDQLMRINDEAFARVNETADPVENTIVRDALSAGDSLATALHPLVAALESGTPLVGVIDLDTWLGYQRDAASGFDAGDQALLGLVAAP